MLETIKVLGGTSPWGTSLLQTIPTLVTYSKPSTIKISRTLIVVSTISPNFPVCPPLTPHRAYEISNFFGKEPPPKEWLEERSAAGGSIMTRTAEDFQEASPRPESKGDKSPTPPTSEKRSMLSLP